jgi:hypothetical protein
MSSSGARRWNISCKDQTGPSIPSKGSSIHSTRLLLAEAPMKQPTLPPGRDHLKLHLQPRSNILGANPNTTVPPNKSTQHKRSKGTTPYALSARFPGSRHHISKPIGVMSSKIDKGSSAADPDSEADRPCLPLRGIRGSSETTSNLTPRTPRSRSSQSEAPYHSSDADISSGPRRKSSKERVSKHLGQETQVNFPPTSSAYRRRYRGYGV